MEIGNWHSDFFNNDFFKTPNSTFVGNFTSLIGRLRHRIVLTCMLHVQNFHFSSYNQSDHCFPALSLLLLPSLLKPSTAVELMLILTSSFWFILVGGSWATRVILPFDSRWFLSRNFNEDNRACYHEVLKLTLIQPRSRIVDDWSSSDRYACY